MIRKSNIILLLLAMISLPILAIANAGESCPSITLININKESVYYLIGSGAALSEQEGPISPFGSAVFTAIQRSNRECHKKSYEYAVYWKVTVVGINMGSDICWGHAGPGATIKIRGKSCECAPSELCQQFP